MPTNRFGRPVALLAVIGALVAALLSGGCQRDTRSVGQAGIGDVASSSTRSQTILDSAAGALADLPEQSILVLRPPSVVLDATKSSDGQDVMAELTTLSTEAFPTYNILRVPKGNARFKALSVKPGDMIKWYANQQSELASEYSGGGQRLSPGQVLAVFQLPVEQQRAIASARASQGDTQLQDILRLPEVQREEVLDSMQGEMNRTDEDIISTTAFEFNVEQVLDTNTLQVDLSSLSPQEQGRLLVEVPMRMEIYRFRDTRFSDLLIELNRYARRGVPLLGWEPSPDQAAIEQIVERLNQWLRQTKTTVEWQPTELLESLPQSLRETPELELFVSDEALNRSAFSLPSDELRDKQAQGYEGRLLQEATWARDISNWVTDDLRNDRDRVDKLFDWTVRNLQLDEPNRKMPSQRPWQAMLHGHATPEGRAWVFAQLCRQQEIPVVVIRPAGNDGPLWCGALVDDQLLLFDPGIGLPIEGDDGQTLTLAEVRADPSALDSLSLEDEPYLPDDVDLERLSAEVVAGPFSLTRRAALLESRLSGEDSLLLAVDADQLATDVQKSGGIESVVIWPHPYEATANQLRVGSNLSESTPEQSRQARNLRTRAAIEFEPFVHKPRLWKARLLHFRGDSGTTIDTSRANLETKIDDHRDAGRLYTDENIRPTDRTLQQLEADEVRRAWTAAKQNATYWLGLLSFDRGDYETALTWLNRAADNPQWQPGARYNQARTLNELGRTEEAIELLETSDGPMSQGNRLLAERWRKQLAAKPTPSSPASE